MGGYRRYHGNPAHIRHHSPQSLHLNRLTRSIGSKQAASLAMELHLTVRRLALLLLLEHILLSPSTTHILFVISLGLSELSQEIGCWLVL